MTINQVRGMLLEEALLHLLRKTGYSTVEDRGDDPTLGGTRGFLKVRGRGVVHQIDAIADYQLQQPFSNPQRLLVEAKCYNNSPVGKNIVSSAVGVLKDIEEFYAVGIGTSILKKRYHYQFALFSASGYTHGAQRYAFAQDIYLIPLANSTFFRPVIESIYNIREDDLSPGFLSNANKKTKQFGTENFRIIIRDYLREHRTNFANVYEEYFGNRLVEKIFEYYNACIRVNYVFLAVLDGGFLVFLVPNPELNLNDLHSPVTVRIFWSGPNWYIEDIYQNRLFSFDLPTEILSLYKQDKILTQKQALIVKGQIMSQFHAVHVDDEGLIRIFSFNLDREWLENIRRKSEKRGE